MKLIDNLLEKSKKQELAHFYILETTSHGEASEVRLLNFVHQFIKDYYQKVEGHKQSLDNLMDYPDIFVLGNTFHENEDHNDKFFKVEEAQTLNRFFEFKPVQSKRKFAIITEAHRINTIVANKWLKLLEEPQGVSTIFLLNPRGGQLLPTLHSRAIHLRIPGEKEVLDFSDWNDFLKDIREMPLAQFLETHSKDPRGLAYWVGELISWESQQDDGITAKDQLGTWLRDFQEMETFHQPGATKWTLFYSYIHENVLKRLN